MTQILMKGFVILYIFLHEQDTKIHFLLTFFFLKISPTMFIVMRCTSSVAIIKVIICPSETF